MREFGNPLGDRPPLDELARTDLLLDALAERDLNRVDGTHRRGQTVTTSAAQCGLGLQLCNVYQI